MEETLGFTINSDKKYSQEKSKQNYMLPENDGSLVVSTEAGGFDVVRALYNYSSDSSAQSESDLINIYRNISLYPEIDFAVEEICNEAIVTDDNAPPVTIKMDNIDIKETIKEKIKEEFETVLKLMNFNSDAYNIFRKWYIDSKVIYQKVIDKDHPKDGIVELRPIDPRKMRKIKEMDVVNGKDSHVKEYVLKDEYFVYYTKPYQYNTEYGGGSTINWYNGSFIENQSENVLKFSKESIAFCHSGLVDPTSGMIYGFLQKSIKVLNQLRMLEDAIVIYRLVRAPERRVFYIDVGNMPPKKAEEYVREIQAKYRNSLTYDVKTGKTKDNPRIMSMQEDLWMPRREGGSATNVETLQGANNLDDISDILMFKDGLWKSLNIPSSRFKEDSAGAMILGFSSEISREELKFSKFITRLRRQFTSLFNDILKTQLLLKNIINEDEWSEIKENIIYDFNKDSSYQEARDVEILQRRVELADSLNEYVGKYISHDYIRKTILKQTDDEIELMDKQIKEEKKNDQYNQDEDLVDIKDPLSGDENSKEIDTNKNNKELSDASKELNKKLEKKEEEDNKIEK